MVDRHVALYARVSTERQARTPRSPPDRRAARAHRRRRPTARARPRLSRRGIQRLDAAPPRAGAAARCRGCRRHRATLRPCPRPAGAPLRPPGASDGGFRRASVEVVFLNRPIGGTAEDDLLLQIQGVIAEYERAKILERSRRGRRHAARAGLVSAFTTAPFGYRYVTKDQGDGVARFEVVPEEARMVRLSFAWVGLERLSLRGSAAGWRGPAARPGEVRRGGTPPRSAACWLTRPTSAVPSTAARASCRPAPTAPDPPPSATVAPADRASGRAAGGVDRGARARAGRPGRVRGRPGAARREPSAQAGPAARPSLAAPGLTVCRRCGYAYYGRAAPRSKRDPSRASTGAAAASAPTVPLRRLTRFDNPPVRGDRLEAAVWDRVRALLEGPARRPGVPPRLDTARDSATGTGGVRKLDRQIAALRRGVGQLIDSYAEGMLDPAEFKPHVAGLKVRVARLEEQHRAAAEAADAGRS